MVATAQSDSLPGTPLTEEEWGDIVDRREFLYDDPSFGGSAAVPFTSLDDRSAGRFRPVYETEQDLSIIRGVSRNLVRLSGVRTGVLDALTNYVFGGGFTFTAQAETNIAQDAPAGLVEMVQRIVDETIDANDFTAGLDREIDARSREDGESFIELLPRPGGRVKFRLVEPDQVTEPANPRPLEDWIGCGDDFASCWRFGVHTRAGQTDEPLGYHVVYDGIGRNWDYVPEYRMQHVKRNVTRNAKRGLSDFYEVFGDLSREAKMRRNMAEGAALQAAIAWIMEFPAGATQTQIANFGNTNNTVRTRQVPQATGGFRTQKVQHYAPGSVLKPSPGVTYKPGPMGAERNNGFQLVGAYVLRSIGVRWNMPEYMVSGDASNANFASTLIAESPFVKAREADQQFYRRHFLTLLWKALRLAWEEYRFERLGIEWHDIVRFINLKCDVPSVATRDMLKLAQTQEAQIRMGILSRRTAATQAGLDYDAEVEEGAKPEPAAQPSLFPPSNTEPVSPIQAAVRSAIESVETTEEAKAVLTQLQEAA